MTEATLRFDGDVDVDKIRDAAELLHEAGVTFDTGTDFDGIGPVPEWELDWSLEGATLEGRDD